MQTAIQFIQKKNFMNSCCCGLQLNTVAIVTVLKKIGLSQALVLYSMWMQKNLAQVGIADEGLTSNYEQKSCKPTLPVNKAFLCIIREKLGILNSIEVILFF